MEVFIFMCWIACGILCAYIGSEKGRSGWGWFFAGAVFGIFAIIAVCAVGSRKV